MTDLDKSFERLVGIMRRLRGPGGCPWDAEQTHDSLKRYLIEEAYEVIEAIDKNDSELLKEELGDLLLQPIFHADSYGENSRHRGIADQSADAGTLSRRSGPR